MLNKINAVLFYLSFIAFILNAIIYFMGFIEIIAAINYALLIFGFVCLFLGLMLTKNAPLLLKMFIVGLIGLGAAIWLMAIFKVISFAIYWKFGMLFIFLGIIWAIWNKVFPKGNFILKLIFGLSAFALLMTTLLTCFSYFDQSDTLFYSLITFTGSSVIIMLRHKSKKLKKD